MEEIRIGEHVHKAMLKYDNQINEMTSAFLELLEKDLTKEEKEKSIKEAIQVLIVHSAIVALDANYSIIESRK
ncbi:hypothetical protein [Facklamia sp. 7083-14-GEN3]|uniref:hypothetical protein n=1 Tax=Facklamia sp. 7083-14-GEN3 TaxID=2973478 RepID=UPI00215D012B|nr:hypothetical protein [Facklamia sp. 7083-14-GEN3]MCR8969304.1 hypothetical protein [Facklamia sp. 7083-14-GEN3]